MIPRTARTAGAMEIAQRNATPESRRHALPCAPKNLPSARFQNETAISTPIRIVICAKRSTMTAKNRLPNPASP